MSIYRTTGDVIEIVVRDNNHRKIDTWKFNAADTELASGIISHIQKKYGISMDRIRNEANEELERLKNMPKKDFLDS